MRPFPARSLTLVCLWLFSLTTNAQTPLSLQEAVQTALAQSYDARLAARQAEIDRTNDAPGQAGLFPTLTLNANNTNNSTFRQPSNPFALAGENRSHALTGSANAEWTLYDGMTAQRERQRLSRQRAFSAAQERTVRENVAEAVVNAYYRAQLEAAKREAQREILDLSREQFDYARFQYETGRADLFDVSQEESRYLSDSLAYAEQALALNNAYRELNLQMGLQDPQTRYALTDSLDFAPLAEPYADLLARAQARNANVREGQASLAVAEQEVLLAESDKMPELTLNLGYSAGRNWFNAQFPNDEGGLTRSTEVGYDYGPYANLAATFTVFDGGQLDRAVRTAQIRRDMALLRLGQAEQLVEKQFADAFDLYQTRIRQLAIARQSRRAAATSLSLAKDRLDNGAISTFEYRQVQTAYLDAANAYLDALFNAVAARTRLLRLTGEIIE